MCCRRWLCNRHHHHQHIAYCMCLLPAVFSLPGLHSPISARHNHAGSQSALPAMAGYCLPSRSTVGVQEQRCAAGMPSMTAGTWLPQPHQEALSVGREHEPG